MDTALADQDYTVEDLFELSNGFYTGLGLRDMQECYDDQCGTVR